MRFKKICSFILTLSVASFTFVSSVSAAVSPATLALSNTSGDVVRVQVTGTPNSAIQLSFLPQGSSTLTSISFGTTDGNGNFDTSISSGGYGIPQNSPAYVTVSGAQSATQLWPTYTSSLIISQADVQVSVGQQVTLNASSAIVLVSNSLPTSISTTISGSQLVVSGLANGTGTITVCGGNVGCKAIPVVVGGATQSQITFSQNNFSLNARQSSTISIFGGSVNGYQIKANTNPTAVEVHLAGTSNQLTLYGTDTPGSATISICSAEDSNNCADLLITTIGTSTSLLSFNQNNLSLIPGLTQTVVVSGGPDNNYYISSNSNSAVAVATISANTVTIVGGTSAASTVIVVCSTSVNATCGNITATLTTTQTTASATTLSFSQNVVSLPQNSTSQITVTGGTGLGYVISSNTNPAAVTASVGTNNNIVTFYGNAVGSAMVGVCSAASSGVCANVYVTVGAALLPITLSQANLSLSQNGSQLVTISGGNDGGKTITSTSNSNVASATLNSNGNVLVVTAGNVNGTSAITICATANITNCTVLTVTVGAAANSSIVVNPQPSVIAPPIVMPDASAHANDVDALRNGPSYDVSKALSLSPTIETDHELPAVASTLCTADSLIRASGRTVYYCGSDGKRYVFPNQQTYLSWYADFSKVQIISDTALSQIPLGGNVTYRPGVRMVKIQSDPKVYAVAPGGVLRWVSTAAIAAKYYGSDWSKKIDDVADSYFTNYKIGADITQ